jgi:3',5'-cyclic AMP phosphodiesterase CpdA
MTGDAGTLGSTGDSEPQSGRAFRVVQVSDTHLSRWDGPLRRNFRALAHFVNSTLRPDLVINTGDIIMANPDSDEDYQVAADLHGLFSAPVRFLPGNHDVGEAYDRTTWWATTSERMARFRRFFGDAPWIEWLGDVALIGLNSQVLGSGIAEEADQWRWLEAAAGAVAGRQVIVFQHMSFWTPYSGSDQRPGGISEADRERVLRTLREARVWGIANGHVHRYRRTWQRDNIRELWAPPTSFLVEREESARLPAGLEELGVVLFTIGPERIEATFQTTPGLEEVVTGGFAEAARIRTEIAAARQAFGGPG